MGCHFLPQSRNEKERTWRSTGQIFLLISISLPLFFWNTLPREERWPSPSLFYQPEAHLLHKGVQIKLTTLLPLLTTSGGFYTLPIYHGLHRTEPFHSCSQGCPLCHRHMHFVLFPGNCVGVMFSPRSFLYAKSECVSRSFVPDSFRSHGV